MATKADACASSKASVVCDVCRKAVGEAMRCACAASGPLSASREEEEPSTLNVPGHAAAAAAAHFDCSICLDVCGDPVVTFCGHLFCCPCLYAWLHLHSLSQHCPVCKANVHDKIIPLYGCGRGAGAEHAKNSTMFPNMQVPCHPSPNSRSDDLASTNAIIHNDGERIVQYGIHTMTARQAAAPASLGFFASMFRCGMAALPRVHAGTSILIPRQSFRIQNELILHWAFICFASIASVFFIVC